MANTPSSYLAGGTIRTARFVKITAAHTVSEADANEKVAGISQVGSNKAPLSDLVSTNYAAEVGEQLQTYGPGDECLITAGDTITAGDRLKSDADGQGVPVAGTGTTLQEYGAIALDAGSVGELVRCFVELGAVRPAIV